ncbi:MAG: ABC transporter permease [Planctomycetaceae bacterium]|nr:ABC transporter permease [Planctomycetaceae bacterium]
MRGQRTEFRWWHEVVLLGLLAALLLTAESRIPGFVSWRSQLFLSRHLWEFAILATGMTLIIISGGIDLSVGSAMGLCAVAFGICFQFSGSLWISAIACLLTGLLGGVFNGVLIARFRLHPLIVTLATFAAFRGIAEGISQGQSYSQFGDAFSQLARGTWFSVPIPGFIFAFLACSSALLLAKTPPGRFLYAIGHNPQAARFSGVPVSRIRVGLYAWSGLLAGLATLIYVSRFDTAKADAGKGFELDVITAVVVGGTSIFGGRGTIIGTTLGLLLIHETRLFVGRYWRTDEFKSIVVGLLLIASVLIYRLLTKRDEVSKL